MTKREYEMLILVANGLTMRETGERLGIKGQTVKNALCNVYAELGVRGHVEAFRKLGWLTTPRTP